LRERPLFLLCHVPIVSVMSANALRAAWAKVERAKEQIQAFQAEQTTFFRSQPPPYTLVANPDFDCLHWVVFPRDVLPQIGLADLAQQAPPGHNLSILYPIAKKYRVMLVVNQLEPRLRWGAMIGEIVHNLRSALDYVAWELTTLHQRRGLGVHLTESQKRRVQFPVSEVPQPDPQGFKPHPRRNWPNETQHLAGIDPTVWARFERFQPHRLKRRYKSHLLWKLNDYWNWDKHRTIRVRRFTSQILPVGIELASPENNPANAALLEDFSLEPLGLGSIRPLKDGTEVGRFVLNRTRLTWPPRPFPPAVDMNPEMAFDPSLQISRGRRRHEALFPLLDALASFVEDVLTDFDVEFP
jgi:hypothetical protein